MNHRVLLIDGDGPFAADVRQACTRRNLDVIVAASGLQGLEAAWQELPSAIILAVELPDANGFAICCALKKNPRLRQVPLVLASSRLDARAFDRHATLKGRADRYFLKRAPADDLLADLMPLLAVPRDAWLQRLASIPAEKPVVGRAFPSFAVWACILAAIAGVVLWLATLH